MITRKIEKNIPDRFFSGKAILIIGARQVGKTTLARKIIEPFKEETLWLTADAPETEQMLTRPTLARLKAIIGKNRIVEIGRAHV